MEKEHQPDSMNTVAMKPDYPPSEVYSTSEPPPAYRHPRPASVQIAKIAAVTIIISSMVLGSFILAASYVQARAGCSPMDQLETLLEKELALEARQMEADSYSQEERLPSHAQALHQTLPEDLKHESSKVNEEKLQSLDDSSDSESDTSSDSSSDSNDSSDENASDIREPVRITLPLQLDFDELAGALIEKNQRSRMNCIVEKRRAEELVDHQARNVQLPFGLNLTTDPRLQRITGERMAIFCESGNENRPPQDPAAEIMPGLPVPLPGPVSLPMNFPMRFAMRPPMPAQHMQAPAPQQAHSYQMPEYQQQEVHQFRPSFVPPQVMNQRQFHVQIPQHVQQQPQQMTLIPREVRIHVQRLQMPQVEPESVPQDSHMPQEEHLQEIHLQRMPLPMISEDDLRAVQQAVRAAEQEHAEQQRVEEQEAQEAQAHEASHEMLGRQAMARAVPIHIPVPMSLVHEVPVQDPGRPHYVQPRSVRSADSPLHREKRVKRSCSCDCAC